MWKLRTIKEIKNFVDNLKVGDTIFEMENRIVSERTWEIFILEEENGNWKAYSDDEIIDEIFEHIEDEKANMEIDSYLEK